MGWTPLGTQFCLELAFGVLVALAFVPTAPVGRPFYRLMATTALIPIVMAAVLPVTVGGGRWSDPGVWLAGLAIVTYPIYTRPARGSRWWVALGVALLGVGGALALALRSARLVDSALEWTVASFSALATGSVAGSVGLAMVLGHWYLTVPTLDVRHLRRLNRVCLACMGLSMIALVASYLLVAGSLHAEDRFGTWGLFYVGTRATVGLVLPLVFGWMAASSLKYSNTRSATGILYASTVLVLIGTAVSISLQDSYGFPL